ncbi:MAG TPA: MerR family transcriptional regulator [Verrucomicrobiae bacterium]|nr:MerR family transcriptional regulator [Verrucomicrobiae bacterium]
MNGFHDTSESPDELQIFEPGPEIVYTIEETARLAQVPRHRIAIYYKYGLVSPTKDPEADGWFFNDEAIRLLRRIEYLRETCGLNMTGIKLVMELMREVEHLNEQVRFLQGR